MVFPFTNPSACNSLKDGCYQAYLPPCSLFPYKIIGNISKLKIFPDIFFFHVISYFNVQPFGCPLCEVIWGVVYRQVLATGHGLFDQPHTLLAFFYLYGVHFTGTHRDSLAFTVPFVGDHFQPPFPDVLEPSLAAQDMAAPPELAHNLALVAGPEQGVVQFAFQHLYFYIDMVRVYHYLELAPHLVVCVGVENPPVKAVLKSDGERV